MFSLVSIALVACVQDRSLAGDWVGKVKIQNPDGDELSKEIETALSEAMSLSLSLKADGSYRERVMFFTVEGRWKIEDGSLKLQPEKVDSKPLDQIKDPGIKKEIVPAKEFEINKSTMTFGRKSPEGEYREEYRLKAK